MLIARVIGDIVATQKDPSHHARKILLVQPLNLDGSDRGEAVVALDAVDAGIGERVLLSAEGFSAMTAVGRPNSPIDTAVIGIIDEVTLDRWRKVASAHPSRGGSQTRPRSPPRHATHIRSSW